MLLLGNGSNVLFADAGFDGVVVHLGGPGFTRVALERDAEGPGRHRLEAGAGLSITKLLRFTKEENVDGLEVLGGVPGTAFAVWAPMGGNDWQASIRRASPRW